MPRRHVRRPRTTAKGLAGRGRARTHPDCVLRRHLRLRRRVSGEIPEAGAPRFLQVEVEREGRHRRHDELDRPAACRLDLPLCSCGDVRECSQSCLLKALRLWVSGERAGDGSFDAERDRPLGSVEGRRRRPEDAEEGELNAFGGDCSDGEG